MNHYEIVTKLIGPVAAMGESHLDKTRSQNLGEMIDLIESLIGDINRAAQDKGRQEHSMKVIGMKAHTFLNDLRDELNDSA